MRMVLLFSALVFSSFTGLMSEAHAQHVHGKAHLQMLFDQERVSLVGDFPAEAIIGFEGRPQTPEQIAAVDQARARLSDLVSWLGLTDVCETARADVTYVSEDGHGAFTVEGEFSCSAAPEALQIELFDHYANLYHISLEIVMHDGRVKLVEMSPVTSQLDLVR